MKPGDDAEALYTRASTLERELQIVREQLERLRPAPPEDQWEPETPVPSRDATPPPWLTVHRRRASLLDDSRKLLGLLDDNSLSLVAPILEELAAPSSPEMLEETIAKLRAIVENITRSAWTR
ncbi:MAG: hypothetical protein AB7T06_12275 [Kofleriaceae bacterium]